MNSFKGMNGEPKLY